MYFSLEDIIEIFFDSPIIWLIGLGGIAITLNQLLKLLPYLLEWFFITIR
ncbi:MAG: hypothetical protein KIH69_014495 [Anaerolineae bacterium]|nr:hypothetical protein [Anaerolineae bacterium]